MNIRLTKYLALAAFSFVLASCTDEDIISPTSQYRDGDLVTLSFNISVPEAEEVAVTRVTNENDIDNLTLLVFSDNSDEGVLKQVYTSYEYDGEFSETGTMTNGVDDTHKKFTATVQASTETKAIYILANAGYLLFERQNENFNLEIGNTTVKDLRDLQTYETLPYFIMSGCKELPIPHAYLLTQDFPLYRTHAKVTVDVAESLKEDFTLEGFYLCNTQKNGSVVAYPLYGETTSTATLPEATNSPNENNWEYDNWLTFDKKMYTTKQAQYPAPTANEGVSTDKKNTKLFLLIKGNYKGDTYYYHADFKAKEGPLDVRPNHHYQVTSTKVDRIGYVYSDKGCKGAIAGAENIAVDIKDINPDSHHLASDGVTEIGVESDTLSITGTDENASITFNVTVNLSAETAEAPSLEFTWDQGAAPSWLAQPTAAQDQTTTSPSKVWNYTVTLQTTQANPAGERREARLGISCRGVLCYVTVIQEPDFSAHQFGSVSLTVKEYTRDPNDWSIIITSDLKVSTDYWKFIHNEDSNNPLYGINPDDMHGKVRTEGFHAPMSDYQQFIYTFTVPNGGEYANYTWHIELAEDYQTNSEGKPFLLFWENENSQAGEGKSIKDFIYHTTEQEMTGQTFIFTNNLLDLQNDGNITDDAYRYGEKAFRIILTNKSNNGEKLVFAYDLYHTGVFDYYKNDNEYEVSGRDIQTGWYYYEVILMGSNYWLDRNLGATSASYYTQDVDKGDAYAAGGLYRIAKNENGSPVMLSKDELEDIAPKGFRVPTMTEFQILTQDSRFHHDNLGSYWTNYYDTGKPEQGRVYFPKSGMWYNNQEAGSGSTGYYWTQSQALDASGTERGWWLQNMQFAGSNSSPNRYRIQASNTLNYTGMSVRCVYNSRRIETINTIEFYVKGYTHVFLYYQEPGSNNRTFLNAWPGDQIAVNEPASLNMYHTFKYESMMDYGYENLRVVFNKVETNPDNEKYLQVIETYPKEYSTEGGLPLKKDKPFFSKGSKDWSDKAQQ